MFPPSLCKIDIVCLVFQWNGTTTFSHLQLRERTDYGMCCWFTPQFNFTEILRQSELDGLTEPDWGHWFMKIDKASYQTFNKYLAGIKKRLYSNYRVQKREKITATPFCLT